MQTILQNKFKSMFMPLLMAAASNHSPLYNSYGPLPNGWWLSITLVFFEHINGYTLTRSISLYIHYCLFYSFVCIFVLLSL